MRPLFESMAAIALMGLGLMVYIFGTPTANAVTSTIIGWNVPNGTTFGHGLVVIILPLAGMALFASFPLMLEQKGNFIVTMALIGLVAGNLLGMMSVTGSDPSDISFAFPVLAGVFLVLWLWKGN